MPTPVSELSQPLNLKTRLAYGVGELAGAVPSGTAAFFLLHFLTTNAGLNPSLAGSAMLLGKLWDAVNDPLVGSLSDRTRSPIGRRYPWMLGAALPLGLYCILQWIVPPTQNQILLWGFYSAVALFAYTAFSAMMVPYSALAAELTQGYDERTTLMSFKSSFSLLGNLFALIMAQVIFGWVQDPQQRYLWLGAVNGVVVVGAIVFCVWGTYDRYQTIQHPWNSSRSVATLSLHQQLQGVRQNRPFLYVIGLYLCAWTGVQIAAVILPYFVIEWMGLSKQDFITTALAILGSAVVTLPFWNWVGRRTDKRTVYFLGVPLAIGGLMGLFVLEPTQVAWMSPLAMLTGVGVATVYLAPWSMLPDVVDLDELLTGQRREGIFYGSVVFLQKMGMAIAVFLTGKILDWAGLVTNSTASTPIQQPQSALWAIRCIFGLLPIFLLLGGLLFASFYPISRDMHGEILLKLQEKHSINKSGG